MNQTTQRRADLPELRARAAAIRKHVLANLDHYLVETEKQVTAHGGQVVFAQNIDEIVSFIQLLAQERGVASLVGSRATEVRNEASALWRVVEALSSDVASYISGRIAPPIDAASFELQRLLAAGIGITGANFVIADAGAVCLAEGDDFASLAGAAPQIHIVIAGIEKIIPRTRDLAVFLRLLSARYPGHSSLLSGPRRAAELDGPEAFYLILLDGGRSAILADPEKRELLQCIRCGACLESCPVTPVGQPGALTQLLTPPHAAAPPVQATTLCGACREACPVNIDLPRALVALRQDAFGKAEGWTPSFFRAWAFVLKRPRLYEMCALMARAFWPIAWKGVQPPAKSFRQLWRERSR
ncbi:MAG: LUD domain-containing protein [Acidobacteria bacterium]|nr:LUD domain-containing protein [Acidobacteriota bacterium]